MGKIKVRPFWGSWLWWTKSEGFNCGETHLHNLATALRNTDIEALVFRQFKVDGLGVFCDCMGFQTDFNFSPNINGDLLMKQISYS